MAKIGVIVVAFNSGDVLPRALEALEGARRALLPQHRLDVVIVDNASDCPVIGTNVQRLESNIGFSPAVNVGARSLNGADFVMLLNPDAVVTADAVKALVSAFDDPDVAVAGPLLVTENGASLLSERPFHTLGRELQTQFMPFLRRPPFVISADGAGRCLTGACLMIDRRFFDEVGGLDEKIRMYLEDVELCWQAARRGRVVRFVPEARVVHGSGQSSGGQNFQTDLRLHLTLLAARVEFVRRRKGVTASAAMRAIMAVGASLRLLAAIPARRAPAKHLAVLRWALVSGRPPAWD